MPVRLKREAARELGTLPTEAQARLLLALESLADYPTRNSPNVRIKQMRGHPGFWRLSVGVWRAVYKFDGASVVVYIVGHRKVVYTQFEARSRG